MSPERLSQAPPQDLPAQSATPAELLPGVAEVLGTPFYRHLALPLGLLILGFTLLAAIFLGLRQSGRAWEDASELLSTRLEQLQAVLGDARSLDPSMLQSRVDRLAAAGGLRLTLIDADGRVLADSHEQTSVLDNHLQRPEILAARNSGEGWSTRYSQSLGREFLYHAQPWVGEQGAGGYLRLALPVEELRAAIARARLELLLTLGGLSLLALLVAGTLAWRLARPVEQVSRLAEDIARGDFERRLPEAGVAGLGRLSAAVNELARDSAQRLGEITADRNRLAAVFAGMVEGVIDVDPQQRILHLNQAAANLLGLNPKACVNQPFWDVLRLPPLLQALDEALKTRDVATAQLRLSRERADIVVNIHAASLSTAAGKPLGAVIVLNDITRLEQQERIRTDFVANASHELKTPITAIRGLAETLLDDGELDPETRQRFITRIHQQSLRLSQLIADLLVISRLESREAVPAFQPVELGEVVRASLQAMEGAREEKRLRLELDLPSSRVEVDGDRQALGQLMDNLIDNAIKYTPPEGHIRVSLAALDDRAELCVEDSGIGISPQDRQRVFERFYRVDKARSQSLGGTGLGLAIVKHIVEQHGGQVRLDSQLGRGSRFRVSLPLLPGAACAKVS